MVKSIDKSYDDWLMLNVILCVKCTEQDYGPGEPIRLWQLIDVGDIEIDIGYDDYLNLDRSLYNFQLENILIVIMITSLVNRKC